MRSSYKTNNYGFLIESITRIVNPLLIVEFGILDGYSLEYIIQGASSNSSIVAYDLFDKFPFNHADKKVIDKFKDSRVSILYGDFYNTEIMNSYPKESIDLFHIDIANNGDVYEFFFENYIKYLNNKGIALLEGGSEERDNIEWMKKYNKPKIQPILDKYRDRFNIFTFQPFPSLTIVSKKK